MAETRLVVFVISTPAATKDALTATPAYVAFAVALFAFMIATPAYVAAI